MDVEAALRRNRTFQSTRSLDPLLSRAHAVAKLPEEPESRSQELAATLSEMRGTCTALAARIATKRTQAVEAHEVRAPGASLRHAIPSRRSSLPLRRSRRPLSQASTAEAEDKLEAMFRERVGRARVAADQRIEDLDRRFAEEARRVLRPTVVGAQEAGDDTAGAEAGGGREEARGEDGSAGDGDGDGAQAPDTAGAGSSRSENGDGQGDAAASQ